MEDLKEIGYEGGKTTHGDVRQAINANVATANGNFSEVSAAATEAQQTAATAKSDAATAKSTAETAKSTAETAKSTAETAKSTAETAKSTAETASQTAETAGRNAAQAVETATAAQTAAGAAQEAAGEAKTAAGEAKTEAGEAKTAAADAQHTAEAAKTAAEAAKTAAEGAATDAATAKSDAATAKSDAATAKSTAETAKSAAETAKSTAETAKSTADTAKSTADTAKSTADTAKSTADTAKSTADTAKSTAEGLTEEVTELGQQLDDVSADATGATDGLHQFMTQGILTQAPFPRATAEASGSFAAVGGDAALKDGEIIPWTGWLTLVLCYQTSDSATKVKLTGYAGQTLGKCELIAETAVAATEEPKVVRITGEHDYNPRRNGSPDACMAGSDYYVNVEVKSPNAGFTMLWAVVYESDEYGNPRRRGGSERELLTRCNCIQIVDGITSTYGFFNNYAWSKPVYNDNTGLFEMNGLVDLTWNDMRDIVENDPFDLSTPQTTGGRANAIRTNKTSRRHYNIPASAGVRYANYVQSKNEVFAVPPPSYDMRQLTDIDASFYANSNLRAILCVINPSANPFDRSTKIETFVFKDIDKSITISASDYISYDSLAYMIDKATNSSAITVTVSAAIYAKLSGSTIENWGDLKVLAGTKNVKLVAKGDAGYPFLKNVLWHSYAALNKKITDAANGDTIYINTADRYKLGDDDRAAQADNWGTLVTKAAEKNITFAQAE